MSHLFWLSDDQWAIIEPFLPANKGGARRVDDRRVISGIIHVLKSGCRWCDCPSDFGPSTTIYNRFNRWSRKRFWVDLVEALATSGAVTKSTAIDSTYIKAHRSAHGGKGGVGWFDRRPIPIGRQRLRCQFTAQNAAGSQHRSRHSRTSKSQAQNHVRQTAIQRKTSGRKRILPSQRLPQSGHPLRQTRQKLPLSSRPRKTRGILAMIESEP